MFESIANYQGNKFYHINKETINKIQSELGILFPKELLEFYTHVGYGFIKSEQDNFNRIMDPQSVRDFRLREDSFANNPDLDMYDECERDSLMFFEICEGTYLSIGFSKKNNGKIYYGKKKIADSLTEFLTKYQEDENYFE